MKASIVSYLVILTLMAGCTDNNFSESDVRGIWAEEHILAEEHIHADEDRISKLQYNFKPDNTFEILRIELDIDTRAELGYRHRTTGNYAVSGNENKISFSNLESFGIDDTVVDYAPLVELERELAPEDHELAFTIQASTLTLIYPPCGPGGLCVADKILIKQDQMP